MDNPDITVLIWIGAEVVFMVVTINAPTVVDGEVAISDTILICVSKLSDFRARGGIEGAVFVEEA